MTRKPTGDLRRGWTTGACATAATKAALDALWGEGFPRQVGITLPKGETPVFPLAHQKLGNGWAEVGITKDAGDDPDVTHGALIIARVSKSDGGIVFKAGEGVGTVTKAGLPIDVGEPAINPVPRLMMSTVIAEQAAFYGQPPDICVTVGIPDGAEIAKKNMESHGLGSRAVYLYWVRQVSYGRFHVLPGLHLFIAELMSLWLAGRNMWQVAQGLRLKRWCRGCSNYRITRCWIWGILPAVC